MLVLGIETSCDETAAAVLQVSSLRDHRIVSEIVASQIDMHAAYGGVVPELAAREHLHNLSLVVDRALRAAAVKAPQIEGVAVTRGPGLKGCLLTGLEFARGFATAISVPLVGVHHIEGHLVAPFLSHDSTGTRTTAEYPHLALIVSGGHTELHLVTRFSHYQCLARTIDDAAGESFDKSAHLLGLSYPGGAALARLADTVEASPYKLPLVMRQNEAFSFSGLKTAISLLIKRTAVETENDRALLACSIQKAIVDALVFKVEQALTSQNCSTLVLSGGVAANRLLRKRLQLLPIKLVAPTFAHCSDNASMIALAGALRLIAGERLSNSESVLARWPVEKVTQL